MMGNVFPYVHSQKMTTLLTHADKRNVNRKKVMSSKKQNGKKQVTHPTWYKNESLMDLVTMSILISRDIFSALEKQRFVMGPHHGLIKPPNIYLLL